MSTTRTRRRRVDTSGEAEVVNRMEALMLTYHEENEKALRHKRAADAARKELFVLMKDRGIGSHSFTAKAHNGAAITLLAKLERVVRSKVNVEKMRKLVPLKTFMKIVSITQAAAKSVVGTDILEQTLEKTEGSEMVKVKVVK